MSVAIADQVSNRPLRERFLLLQEREGLSASEVAMRAGFVKRTADGREKVDTSYVLRVLGLMTWASCKKANGKRYDGYKSKVVSYDMAVRLADALNMDYWDAGV